MTVLVGTFRAALFSLLPYTPTVMWHEPCILLEDARARAPSYQRLHEQLISQLAGLQTLRASKTFTLGYNFHLVLKIATST